MKNSKHRNQIAHKKQDSLDHIWNHIPYGSIKIPKTDRIKTKKSHPSQPKLLLNKTQLPRKNPILEIMD